MSGYESAVLDPILGDPILSRGSYTTLARLLPHVTEKVFGEGERVYSEGRPADYLYLIRDGKVLLDSPEASKKTTLSGGHFGEEAGTDAPEYLCDATAASALSVLMIPREKLARLIAENPLLR